MIEYTKESDPNWNPEDGSKHRLNRLGELFPRGSKEAIGRVQRMANGRYIARPYGGYADPHCAPHEWEAVQHLLAA